MKSPRWGSPPPTRCGHTEVVGAGFAGAWVHQVGTPSEPNATELNARPPHRARPRKYHATGTFVPCPNPGVNRGRITPRRGAGGVGFRRYEMRHNTLTARAELAVVAQRLARRLCTRCKEPYSPSEAVLEEINLEQDPKETRIFYRPKGCSACGDTGYKGRIGLYEVLIVTEQIELLTIKHASSDEIREVAHSEGMKTLFEDGLEKVKQGLTSLEEIMRVAT